MIILFRLGLEKYKSKVVKNHTPVVKWGELLSLGMYDEQVLEISLWEKETYLGRYVDINMCNNNLNSHIFLLIFVFCNFFFALFLLL